MSLVELGAPSYVLRFRTWYKQNEPFTPTRDLCLQNFPVSDSESAWHLIESTSSRLRISCFGSNLGSSRGLDFYAVVWFLLPLFLDYLWFSVCCYMAVPYWLRPLESHVEMSMQMKPGGTLQGTSISSLSSSSSNFSVWIRKRRNFCLAGYGELLLNYWSNGTRQITIVHTISVSTLLYFCFTSLHVTDGHPNMSDGHRYKCK